MLLRGQALPLRDYFLQRLPAVGSGRPHPIAIVVVGGDHRARHHAGPAAVAGRVRHHVRHGPRAAVGRGHHRLRRPAVARPVRPGRVRGVGRRPARRRRRLAVPAGAARRRRRHGARSARCSRIPAVRARGINLAIVTLGMGSAIELMIFNNGDLVGGFAGTAGRQADAVRLGHQRHLPRRAATPSSAWSPRPGVADGRQHAARSVGSAAARRAHQRTGRRRPRHQRARRQDLRLRRVGRHRRDRRRAAGVPQGRHPLQHASSPTSRRSSSWRGRSSAASASCSARSSARRWRRGRSAAS